MQPIYVGKPSLSCKNNQAAKVSFSFQLFGRLSLASHSRLYTNNVFALFLERGILGLFFEITLGWAQTELLAIKPNSMLCHFEKFMFAVHHFFNFSQSQGSQVVLGFIFENKWLGRADNAMPCDSSLK